MRLHKSLYWGGVGSSLLLFFIIKGPPIDSYTYAAVTMMTVMSVVTAAHLISLHRTKCPRCTEIFAGAGLKRVLLPGRRGGDFPQECVSCGLPFGARNAFDTAPPREMFLGSAVSRPAAIIVTAIFLLAEPLSYVRRSVVWAVVHFVMAVATAAVIAFTLKLAPNPRSRFFDGMLALGVMGMAAIVMLNFERWGGWGTFVVLGAGPGILAALAARSLGLLGPSPRDSGNLFLWGALAVGLSYSCWSIASFY
jgi:hypothetical protein